MKKKCFSFLICMFMLLPGLTQAKDEEPVSTLDEMVVTASRVPEKKRDLTTNVTVIDENDIKLSAAKDLGDLLSEKAGVYIRKYPGNMTSIGLRGFRTETHGNDLKGNVLILLNGRRAGTGNAAKIMTKN
nr:TonB-dependent receptor plug domain-containing protein [Desulfobacterales bacterium]